MQNQGKPDHERALHSLASHDSDQLELMLKMHLENSETPELDQRVYSIVKIAGLAGMDGESLATLIELAQMRKEGLLTEAEFARVKAKLLG
jgi:hypothetical protein